MYAPVVRGLRFLSLWVLAAPGCYLAHEHDATAHDGGGGADAGTTIHPSAHDLGVDARAPDGGIVVPPDGGEPLLAFTDCEGAFGARSFGIDVQCATTTV